MRTVPYACNSSPRSFVYTESTYGQVSLNTSGDIVTGLLRANSIAWECSASEEIGMMDSDIFAVKAVKDEMLPDCTLKDARLPDCMLKDEISFDSKLKDEVLSERTLNDKM